MSKDTVLSVVKAFKIIEILSENESVGVREISTISGINTTTVFRMLTTLVQLGYVAQITENAKYFLTYKLLVVGNSVLALNNMIKLVHPYLQKISDDCKETVHFIERVGTNVRYIDKILPTSGVVAMGSYIGMELPLTSTAVGKSILVELPEEEVKEIWNNGEVIQYTPKTIRDLDVLIKEIEIIRIRGYAIDNEERELGLSCVAVSIPNYKGEPMYAMSVSAPSNKMNGENLERICRILLDTKEKIKKIIVHM
ncbi:IclR family transcriptional regulator [Clostridium bowmanii]|uniref:IclR family transcriptional regulator n=1 Tax=Clostridium bowmanii TaxID=132925 RepID=UPI001C0B0F37|nr:IclR family transcriptional regulator [Clostridium bowmanii]MBU3191940.1 IclR family transcriptional regulator [Clostridium bowmanii]MCA1074503.1 IclR family transcriptional regulator [Clostridium bowmanii]